MKDFISLQDISTKEILSLLSFAQELKAEQKAGRKNKSLKGKTIGLIFTKSSTRTRVSFETGIFQMGGYPLFLSSADIQLGRGESIYDTAKTLSRYLDGIMIRTFAHSDVTLLAEHASIPVINGLTDLLHPCQVLADLLTIQEQKGTFKGLKMCYAGDGNNMANTLLQGCAKVGMDLFVATPKGYEPDANIAGMAMQTAKEMGSKIVLTQDLTSAMEQADVVYTDTWVSMGQENEKQERLAQFSGYQINGENMMLAKKDAIFLHCLPAYRGYEVTADVIDGPRSVVFDEAENRLHAQKAIMAKLLKD